MSKVLKRTTSPYVRVEDSGIHGMGVFARKRIPAGVEIIEYVGEKITKAESERRAEIPLNQHKKDRTKGAVYIFTLNARYDIDGNVPYNTARLINHSCSPNCEAVLSSGHIWITALRDIQQGEELTYNYGYDLDSYEDHPCRCGAENCVGYILAEEHWPKLHFKKKARRPRRKLTHEEIVKRQEKNASLPRLPFVVVLDNLRSLHNVGSAFRTADGVGLEKVWLCGITGFPPQSQISKTAIGAEQVVSWEYEEDVVSVVKGLKRQGYQIVLLEQTPQSRDYHEYEPHAPVCLIIGNEVDGISESVVPLADYAVDIKMHGMKNSLNVSVAFGIAAYHIGNRLRDLSV
ncbi:MAG TPA: TrmH family RNA methyltransferase [Candidatus Omnitrophota bacterium]|nr:TrmH family RNA methyltransferase [Candidatus Omnitrophota bacterium]HSA31634.1 TrmH family RNA methyltransferase [Candidatus Omnitrophota bacterium]